MKPINLYSLISTYKNFDTEVYEKFKLHYGISLKESELEDLNAFALVLYEKGIFELNSFFIGYKIPQINCEFDLLRIGKDSIINIELKRKLNPIKAKKQLVDHLFYLNFLEQEKFCFTFVAEEKKLYTLDENNEFIEISFDIIIDQLKRQKLKQSIEINELFTPSKFLVSPFNSTKKFLRKSYILTEHQQNIKEDIIGIVNKNDTFNFIGIKGGPGTGKTLLTYDIARTLIDARKKVLIIHCAELNSGQKILNTHLGWEIKSVSDFSMYIDHLSEYDLIIFDESQRNKRDQFDILVDKVKEFNKICIFSYDPKQCFSDWEFKRKIPEIIEVELEAKVFPLTNTIRINEELSSFINNLFDKSKVNSSINYKNIDILFFNNSKLAKKHIETLEKLDWEAFSYTGSWFGEVSYDRYQNYYNPNAHQIIGQEFDNIVGVIDENFYYDQFGLLASNHVSKSPGYNMDKMLYQILTRARQKITLIVINNKKVFEYCLQITSSSTEKNKIN